MGILKTTAPRVLKLRKLAVAIHDSFPALPEDGRMDGLHEARQAMSRALDAIETTIQRWMAERIADMRKAQAALLNDVLPQAG